MACAAVNTAPSPSSSHASLAAKEAQHPYNEKVEKVARKKLSDCSHFWDWAKNSKTLQAFVITLLTAGAIAAVLFLVASPVGWLAAALSISTLAAKIILGVAIATALISLNGIAYKLASKKTRQEIAFELSAFWRLLSKKNHHQIPLTGLYLPDGKEGAALFLGALPNRFRFGQGLEDLGKNGAVFSVNEAFELESRGLSFPYSEEDWRDLGIECSGIIARDHELLSPDQMDEAAEKIHEWVKQGKKIYVHCRGGVGRSSTLIAAYLMKYGFKDGERLTLEEICALIKKHRPRATIFNKIPALLAYDNHLNIQNRPPSSGDFNELLRYSNSKAPKLLVRQAVENGRLSLHFPFGPDPHLQTTESDSSSAS